jgi:hypothetical protein
MGGKHEDRSASKANDSCNDRRFEAEETDGSVRFKLAQVLNLRLIILHVVKAPGFEQGSPAARRSLHSLKTNALLKLGWIVCLANENSLMADYRLLVGIPEDSILSGT